MRSEFPIAGRMTGTGRPCFVIAEAGVNHNGDLGLALDLVDVAAEAGADAVKFQTFSADRLVTATAPKAAYQIETTGADESQHAMLAKLELSLDDHRALMRRCDERGVTFLSTPFDEQAADMLESLGVVAYKTPSGELTNLPYLRHVARLGKPMIVSTGMATLSEVEAAVLAVREAGSDELALLHCVSSYPAEADQINLRAMATLERAFRAPVGYSDHSEGIEIALAAVALGACVVEKHYTTDRRLPGPDHRASLEPAELATMIRSIRTVEAALGDGRKIPTAGEVSTAAAARKSLVIARDIAAGEILTDEHVVAKRPGTGLPPSYRAQLVGRTARIALREGTLLDWGMLT